MAAPTLNTYTYQYKDDGIVLNSDAAVPFVDVTKVQGLDMPDVNEDSDDYDGRHGGYGYARYTTLRTIIITGTVYVDVDVVDAFLDQLTTNFMLDDEEYPFYFKGAGINQRYIMCKSLGVKFDVDRLRSIGSSSIQFQLLAGDVEKIEDNDDVTISSGSAGAITNEGNVPTYPIFELSGAASLITMVKESTGETVTFEYVTDVDDSVIVDFETRSCYLNGERDSTLLTSLGWWSCDPGTTGFRVSSNGANIMTNGDCEANFGTGYAVGANWAGTQQYTSEFHGGTKSLYMRRKNKTAANGNVTIPTGLTGLAAGTYTASLWVKGTMKYINIAVLNGAVTVSSVALAVVSSTSWTKLSMTFTLTGTSSDITFKIDDLNTTKTYRVKNKKLYIDDLSVLQIDTTGVTAVVSSKSGWM